jgi:hypothetical protein
MNTTTTMNTINQIFELRPIQLPNGCIGVDTTPIVAAAKAAAAKRPGQTRGPMVQFLVILDGEFHFIKSTRALKKLLNRESRGSRCQVFRNAGNGATVDFDID